MAKFQDNSLIDQKTLIYIPCKSKDIIQGIESNNTYSVNTEGEIYYNTDKACIYGANISNKNAINNQYSKIILKNENIDKYTYVPIIIEFYAKVDISINSNNKFVKFIIYDIKDQKLKELNINLNNIKFDHKILLRDFNAKPGYYFIQIDPNNGRLEIYIEQEKIYSQIHSELEDILINQIEFYLGMVMFKKQQQQINVFSVSYQNDPNSLYRFNTIIEVQHNIYYKDLRIFTGRYDEKDIKNRLNYVKNQKFMYKLNTDIKRTVVYPENKYIDGHEIVNIIPNKKFTENSKDINPILDIGMINKNINNPNVDSTKNFMKIIHEKSIFNINPIDTSLHIRDLDTSIISESIDKDILINNFTIELDIKIENRYRKAYTNIITICNNSNKAVIQILEYYYKNFCELIFILKDVKTEKIVSKYSYESKYNFINRIVLMKANQTFYVFINGNKEYSEFVNIDNIYYGKTIIGKIQDYQNFTGYISKFIISNINRYNNSLELIDTDSLNSFYIEPKIKLTTIQKSFNTIKKKFAKTPIYVAPKPDDNYLIYVDFLHSQIKNRGSNKNIAFKYEDLNNQNPIFVNKEFPGDDYSDALVTSANSKLSINNPSQLNLAEFTNFTIEIDFKLITTTSYYSFIKLFSNKTLNTYMSFEHGHLVFYIGNNEGKQIKLKHYYPLKNEISVHISLQKIRDTFYLIIEDTLVFVNSITDLKYFFIEDIYENQSSKPIMYINRFTVSNIARYNLQDLKEYPLDSQSLIYLPYNSESDFKLNKFPQSDNNNFSVSIVNPVFNDSYFKPGYGVISSGTITYFTLPNKDYDSKNISLHFWNKLIANSTILSNLNCTLVKMRDDLFSSSNDNIHELELQILDSYTLSIKTSVLNTFGVEINSESINIKTNDYTRNLFNLWNNFALTYNVIEEIFTLFLNGRIIYSGKLTYFSAKTITAIALFTSYTYGNITNSGTMQLASVRLFEGLYYTQDFNTSITGLLYNKLSVTDINKSTHVKQEIIYTKYPKNDIGNVTQIKQNDTIQITETLDKYFTFEGWFYTTKNSDSKNPFSIKFVRDYNPLFTLFLTRKNLEEKYIRTSNNMIIRINNSKIFEENQWTHVALTYNKSNNLLKVWINGILILSGGYIEQFPLTDSTKIILNPGTGNSYYDNMIILPTLKYISDFFIPQNSVQISDEYFKYDKEQEQDIPYLIYNKYLNNNTSNSIPISEETGFISNLYNNTDIGHTIEFWLYTDNNKRTDKNPLSINIIAEDKNIHTIILNRYILDNTDDIHWDGVITSRQNSGIILIPEKWVHFALVYNKKKNNIRLYYNGKKILESSFADNISLKTLKYVKITSGIGNTYIEGFIQMPQILYENNFIPNNSTSSGLALPIYEDLDIIEKNLEENQISTQIISNEIGELDDHYITYLDFENYDLTDKSKAKVDWKKFGFLQYAKDIFPHDPEGKALLLTGSSGIYTNDSSLNFNLLNDFTIEMEIKNYTKYANKRSALFINFISWLSITLLNDNTISVNCHYNPNIVLKTSENIDLNDMVYIALQRKNKITSLYINGTLISKYNHEGILKLDNFITMYTINKNSDHIIDIGMTYTEDGGFNNFFSGYINKIAISDIARFDDGGSNENTEGYEKNETTVFYQPVKYPDYNALYRTIPKTDPWYWRYRLKNSKVYSSIVPIYNSKWKNYASIGPSRENKNGFIEYNNSNIYNKSFTFECWMKKDTSLNSDTESKILAIAHKLIIYTGTNGPILVKYENSTESRITELNIENGMFENKWNHIAVTYNYYTSTLTIFINGKFVFATIDFKQFLPVSIQLFTNKIGYNTTYFTSIRYSKGIIYKDNFNISLINKPFTGYEENDKIDFENLDENKPVENKTKSGIIDENVIFYMPFKNGKTNVNDFLVPGIKSGFKFTSKNAKLY